MSVAVPVMVSVCALAALMVTFWPVPVASHMPWTVEAAVNVGWFVNEELNFALIVVDGTPLPQLALVLQFVDVLPFQTDVVVSATIADWLSRNVASIRRPRAMRRGRAIATSAWRARRGSTQPDQIGVKEATAPK